MKGFVVLLALVACWGVCGSDPIGEDYAKKYTTLLEKFNRDHEKLKQDTIKRYEPLLKKFTREGNLSKALEIQKKIDNLNVKPNVASVEDVLEDLNIDVPVAPGTSTFVARLVGTEWTIWGPDNSFKFKTEDSIEIINRRGSHSGSWVVDNEKERKISFKWAGAADATYIVFDRNFKTFSAIDGTVIGWVKK